MGRSGCEIRRGNYYIVAAHDEFMISEPDTSLRNLSDDSCWITWERHQRSRSLSAQLGIPLIEISIPRGRVVRYIRSSFATASVLFRRRYNTVFVQTPSLVLGHLVLIVAAFMRFRVVADAHNAVIEGADSNSPLLRWLYRSLIRRVNLVIVTNGSLAERVQKLGGVPGVLPDPVPLFRPDNQVAAIPGSVVVVSTWAADEPIAEILKSARILPKPLHITITGRPKGPFVAEAHRASNVRMSGFVSDSEYLTLLESAAVVVDLTTREDCLVCGAYEALALGRPLVVSDSRALRDLLRDGAIYCENDSDAIAKAIIKANQNMSDFARRCSIRRDAYVVEWQDAANKLMRAVSRLR